VLEPTFLHLAEVVNYTKWIVTGLRPISMHSSVATEGSGAIFTLLRYVSLTQPSPALRQPAFTSSPPTKGINNPVLNR
jgi:hypothetical protein